METEILNKISNASINGYYDSSLKLVVVWFHNIENNKLDLVAYLQDDMIWDLREVTNENSVLYEDKEIVTLTHKSIGKFKKDSKFDQVVRKILNQLTEHSVEKGIQSFELDMMRVILDSSTYSNEKN